MIDSFAWVEYFRGSPKGHTAASVIESGNALTPIIVIAELSAWFSRENVASWESDFQFIASQTTLIEIPVAVARIAGETRQKMRRDHPNFGLIDAIILELAIHHKAVVVSGDPHFANLPNVMFLG